MLVLAIDTIIETARVWKQVISFCIPCFFSKLQAAHV